MPDRGAVFTFDVHEAMPGQWRWFVYDADGELVDHWGKGYGYDDTAGEHGAPTGAVTFPTEAAAIRHVHGKYKGARNVHRTREG